MNYNVVFTKEDHLILDSCKTVLDGLADYLGEGYEFVLHSLENVDHSVVKIINGHHTGRKEGAPITDLALNMLKKIQDNDNQPYISYNAQNKKGQPLRSATIAIHGTNRKVIGLICINFYLNTPFVNVLENFVSMQSAAPQFAPETFAADINELIRESFETVYQEVVADASVPGSLRNKEIVLRLNERGIFKLKNAVITVANLLGISKNTVYLHLRNSDKQ